MRWFDVTRLMISKAHHHYRSEPRTKKKQLKQLNSLGVAVIKKCFFLSMTRSERAREEWSAQSSSAYSQWIFPSLERFEISDVLKYASRLALMSTPPSHLQEALSFSLSHPPLVQEKLMSASRLHRTIDGNFVSLSLVLCSLFSVLPKTHRV